MLRREGRQGSFWDSEWIEHLIGEESFEWHFRRVVRPLISDEELGTGLERRGVCVVAPLKEDGDGVFSNDLFEYLCEKGKVPGLRCPAGEEVEMRDHTWMGRRFCFTGCGHCPLKQKCTTAENRSVMITPSYFFRKRKAAFNGTASYKDLMRQRSRIERKNGQLKSWFGFRRCRYRGLPKFRFQCFFSALAVNIQRLVSIFITAPPGNPALAVLYA